MVSGAREVIDQNHTSDYYQVVRTQAVVLEYFAVKFPFDWKDFRSFEICGSVVHKYLYLTEKTYVDASVLTIINIGCCWYIITNKSIF